MKFDRLPVEKIVVRVKSIDDFSFDALFEGEGELPCVTDVSPTQIPGVFYLTLEGEVVSVALVDESRTRLLNQEIGMGRTILGELADLASDGSVSLRIAFFPGSVLELGDIDIGVDEYVESASRRLGTQGDHDVFGWLERECVVQRGQSFYFLVVGGPAIADDLEAIETASAADASSYDTKFSRNSVSKTASVPTISNSFCVIGEDIRFVATAREVADGERVFVVTRLTDTREIRRGTVKLARGRLRFTDWTRAGKVQLLASAQLADLARDNSSYLKRWDRYQELEGENFLAEVRRFGCISYANVRSEKGGFVSVKVDRASESALDCLGAMDPGQELSFVSEVPEYLDNPEMTFTEFTRTLLRESEADEIRGRHTKQTPDRIVFEHWDRESRILRLRIEALPPEGKLILSTRGNVAQIKRREHARRQIIEGRTANPQLGLLIEEGGQPTTFRSPQRVKPLSSFVRDKVFKNPPTYMQERAVDVALNTPDIALIQGPPGTGKTTVIAAILERLNELSARDGIIRSGQVLLTGFQQDAVENMIDRISLNGLPVPKFGRRSGSENHDRTTFERNLEAWCLDIAHQLRETNPKIQVHEDERHIRDLYVQYLTMPSNRLALMLLQAINALKLPALPDRLVFRVRELQDKLSRREELLSTEDGRTHVIRGIRSRPESFSDDGPERASDVLDAFSDSLGIDHKKLLEKASVWDNQKGVPPFLRELQRTKEELMYEFTSPPVFRIEKHNEEVLEIAKTAVEVLQESGMSAADKKTAALVSFLAELENNASGMIDAVSAFSFAYSATVQQSVNREVRSRKGHFARTQATSRSEEEEILEYEYVIVDEAARVTPPDLMIALAQGKRIVLVGDHRQLPQLIEKSIEAQMEQESAEEGESEWLKRSMFEYLFSDRLKVLEERDGIQRRVTLDQQFRMHPELGSFISRNFYEKHDQSEGFGSGLPAEFFAHNLSGTNNSPAMWIDVPKDKGIERRPGTSYVRQAEIDPIIRQLSAWITSSEGRNLTYGVISFYKAQADAIRTAVQHRLGSHLRDGEQVKIGTVDSFQGMEFDVVLLSVVRTLKGTSGSQQQEESKQAMRIFGHLCLSNRLNVSMSRQKKLLVIVGDSALVSHPLAEKFVPGLSDFYELAKSRSALSSGIDG